MPGQIRSGACGKGEHDGTPYVACDVRQDRVRLQELLALNGGQRALPAVIWPDKAVQVGLLLHRHTAGLFPRLAWVVITLI
jgi:ABC-type uncharacterized transport system ATPase component